MGIGGFPADLLTWGIMGAAESKYLTFPEKLSLDFVVKSDFSPFAVHLIVCFKSSWAKPNFGPPSVLPSNLDPEQQAVPTNSRGWCSKLSAPQH
jgi:hypothetical protein